MPDQSIELALVATDTRPPRHEGGARSSAAAGPGWFDSSWDLRRGLEVRESWADDEGVTGWIEDFLGNRRAFGRPALPASRAAA